MALPLSAHANSLASTSPASGAVLTVAPNAVSVAGTSTLQSDGNQLSVTDPKGTPVDDGSITVAGSSVVVGLKPLTAAGVYTAVGITLASLFLTPALFYLPQATLAATIVVAVLD